MPMRKNVLKWLKREFPSKYFGCNSPPPEENPGGACDSINAILDSARCLWNI
jgi:hypothetical protein